MTLSIQQAMDTAPVALITGAARRIGAAIAEKLHAAGYHVIVHYHQSHGEARALVERFNMIRAHSAVALHVSLRHQTDAQDLVSRAIVWRSRLDVLVNNASLFIRTPPQEVLSNDLYEQMWAINVSAPYWLSEAAFPFLAVASHGVIVNVTDIHAEKPLRGYSVYCQTKAALKMQTEALAKEYAPSVRVNAVAPGAIAWPEGRNQLSDTGKSSIIARTPLKCHGEPLWIAVAVLSLIQNQFVTGQTLRVDGGRSIS